LVVVLLLVVNLDPIIIAKPLWLRTFCIGDTGSPMKVWLLVWSFSAPAEAPETENLPYKRGEVSRFRWECRAKLFDGLGFVSLVSLGHGLGNQM
jgi:hypothetical protein